MTAEPELPGVNDYAVRLHTAHRQAIRPVPRQLALDGLEPPPTAVEHPRTVDDPPLET